MVYLILIFFFVLSCVLHWFICVCLQGELDLCSFKLGNISFRVVSEIIDTTAPVFSSMISDLLSTLTGTWIGFEASSFNLNKWKSSVSEFVESAFSHCTRFVPWGFFHYFLTRWVALCLQFWPTSNVIFLTTSMTFSVLWICILEPHN